MNRSNDHVFANTSFSIWEYRCSVDVIALEAYAIGRNVPSVLCRMTAKVHNMTRPLTPWTLDWGRTTPAQAIYSAHPSLGQKRVVGSVPTSTDSSSAADPPVAEPLSTGLELTCPVGSPCRGSVVCHQRLSVVASA